MSCYATTANSHKQIEKMNPEPFNHSSLKSKLYQSQVTYVGAVGCICISYICRHLLVPIQPRKKVPKLRTSRKLTCHNILSKC